MSRGSGSIGIADLKAHLSEILRQVRRGKSFTLLDRKAPVARLVPWAKASEPLPSRRALRRLRDVPLPPPVAGVDSLAALLEERQGHR